MSSPPTLLYFNRNREEIVPAARVTADHNQGWPDRRRSVWSQPSPWPYSPLPLSPSFSLYFTVKLSRPVIVPTARPATMASQTSIGCTPDASGGHRQPSRPGEAASTPPGLNRQQEPIWLPLRRRANWLSPLPLSPSVPPNAASGAGGAAGQGLGPARRWARRRARTKHKTGSHGHCFVRGSLTVAQVSHSIPPASLSLPSFLLPWNEKEAHLLHLSLSPFLSLTLE